MIGVGALGRHHARWAARLDDFDLVGVHDIRPDRTSEVAGEVKCRAFPEVADLLDQCQAVSIAVTTSHHYRIALEAIDAGCDLLVEKPLAASLSDADAIIEAAKKKGVKLAVGHIERFNPAVTALKEYDIRPRFIEAHRLAAFNPRGADVAVVLDLMIHDIDLALHLIGAPVAGISAAAVGVISDSEDIANARLTFSNGAVANLTASRISLKPMRKLRLFQSSGYFSLDLAEKQADLYRILDNNARPGELALPLGESGRSIGYFKTGDKEQDMLEAELSAFAAAIRGERDVAVTGPEGRQALEVALRVIEESHKTALAYTGDGK